MGPWYATARTNRLLFYTLGFETILWMNIIANMLGIANMVFVILKGNRESLEEIPFVTGCDSQTNLRNYSLFLMEGSVFVN